MAHEARRKSREDFPEIQRVVERSFLFVHLPSILLVILASNFIWEEIRVNAPSLARTWPFKFSFLDRQSTATLLVVVVGLLLTRLQWARANRPSMAFAITDRPIDEFTSSTNSKDIEKAKKWGVWLYNGGPGIATVEHYSYVVRFVGAPRSVPITLSEINSAMRSRKLRDGLDYFVREQGPGATYPPVVQSSEGTMIAWFTVRGIAELDQLDITIRIRDGLGDVHEMTLPIIDRLPSIVLGRLGSAA
ncbi:hypothetical protein [Cryptosporangium japonicum]|uniref:Uncharacterized protein n=1 Tax=Cryptosporangium japonicum TaxID=80872 RepID=A0ABN0UBK9_9ACTN